MTRASKEVIREEGGAKIWKFQYRAKQDPSLLWANNMQVVASKRAVLERAARRVMSSGGLREDLGEDDDIWKISKV